MTSDSRTRYVLGVCGGSGSGKTTFVRRLAERLAAEPGEGLLGHLSQDHYYIDQSHCFVEDGGDEVNFDHPSAIDLPLMARHLQELRRGRPVRVPLYDFATHTRRDETAEFPPRPLVAVDGTLILSQPGLRACFDRIVFLDIPEDIRFQRRLQRDMEERGRAEEGVRRQFVRQVKPMHDEHVQPHRHLAHHKVTDNETFDRVVEEVAVLLRGVLGR